ncbi:DUF2637 domain-containing protein [Nonomuraea sp. NPDC050786]|uniref:DUF2637 domain-containing protein n=1 Tax=Nonomuraea sp. NPDC050786 TaxID=3154840 RepID=UPI00340F7E5A
MRRRKSVVPVVEVAGENGTARLGDRVILGIAVAVLLGVAAAAAYVSYHHFYALAIDLGERHDMAVLYPAMSDGVIVMASLVMVYCSRRKLHVPVLAWVALAGGGVVTLIANVANGWGGGTGSRLLSALAPVAFVGAYELLMWLVRTSRKAADKVMVAPADDHVCHPVEPVTVSVPVLPVDRFEAARLTYEESLQPGNKRVGRRALANRWGIEIREAEEIIADVDRERSPSAMPTVSGTADLETAVAAVNGSRPTDTEARA